MYKIAIPTYDRLTILKKKVLEFLKKIEVPKNLIFIFIDPRSYEEYLNDLDLEGYNLICGEMGLACQRNFIRDYFLEDEKILHCDDDLISLDCYPLNIKNEIEETFKCMMQQKILLGSFEPTGNHYFRSLNINTGHFLSMGACYPEINSHNKNLYFQYDENEKEDYIRTIKHIRLNGYILRNNRISIVHRSSVKSSMGNLTKSQRDKQKEKAIKNIFDRYSYLLFKRSKLDGYELQFKNRLKRVFPEYKLNTDIQMGDHLNYSIEDFQSNYDFEAYDENNKLLFRFIRNVFKWSGIDMKGIKKYISSMSKLSTNRGNFAGKLDVNKLEKWQLNKIKSLGGEVKLNKNKTATDKKDTGFSWSNPVRSFTIRNNSKTYNNLCKDTTIEQSIKKITKQLNKLYIEYLINPEGRNPDDYIYLAEPKFLDSEFDELIFNYNIQSAIHTDSKNSTDYSIMVTWGNYEGYNLVLPDYNIVLNINVGDVLIFNGKKIRHGNLQGIGNRISIVAYSKTKNI